MDLEIIKNHNFNYCIDFGTGINGKTGKIKLFSKKDTGGDLIGTAFFIQGLLNGI